MFKNGCNHKEMKENLKMKNKYINKIIYSVILVVTFTFMACLDSDNLNEILTPEPEVETLPAGEGLAIGATAPDFSLPDADGNLRSLSEFIGKKVVLVFYRGSW